MAQLLSPLMIEVREPKSFEAMKFPTIISFSFIYMQNVSDLLSVHLNEPCNKLDFSLIQIQASKNISPLVKLAQKSIEVILYLILLMLLNRLATCLVGQDFCIMWWLLKEPFFKVEVDLSLRFFLGLLGQKHSLDVRKNTSLCNGDTSQ